MLFLYYIFLSSFFIFCLNVFFLMKEHANYQLGWNIIVACTSKDMIKVNAHSEEFICHALLSLRNRISWNIFSNQIILSHLALMRNKCLYNQHFPIILT